jgi:hypothetical protein
MTNRKGCHGFLCAMKKEGTERQRESVCVRGRVSEEREVVSVQRSTYQHKHITEMQSDKEDE